MVWLKRRNSFMTDEVGSHRNSMKLKQMFKWRTKRNIALELKKDVETYDNDLKDKYDDTNSFRQLSEPKSAALVSQLPPPPSHLRIKAREIQKQLSSPRKLNILSSELNSTPSTFDTAPSTMFKDSGSETTATVNSGKEPENAAEENNIISYEENKDIGEDFGPLIPVTSASSNRSFSSRSSRGVPSISFDNRINMGPKRDRESLIDIPERSQYRIGPNSKINPLVVSQTPRQLKRQYLLADDNSSFYSGLGASFVERKSDNELFIPERNTLRGVSGHNRVSSVLPQHYRAKPLTKKKQNSIVGSMISDYNDLVFTDPYSMRPSTSNESGSGRSNGSGSGRLARERREKPAGPVMSMSESMAKASNRASITSTLSNILPYILHYNKLTSDASNEPQTPQIDVGSIADTYARVEHIEDTHKYQLQEQSRQIEKLLFDKSAPKSNGKVEPTRQELQGCIPCQESVQAYADKLDKEFDEIREVETNPEFRERIFEGTSYASIQRRSRLLDKDLPHIPGELDDTTKGKGIDALFSKLKLFD